MNRVLFCLALMLQSSVTFAQWVIQPSQYTTKLWSVRIATATTVYSCGDAGTLLKSTDGGTKWTKMYSPLNASFQSVSMIRDTGFFFGYGGSTLWTNRGANPAAIRNYSIPGGTPYPLSSHIFSIYSAIACGEFWSPQAQNQWSGYVITTTNAGINWTYQVHDSLRSLRAVRFYDANNGVMIGKRTDATNTGVLLKTSDRGSSWTAVPTGFSKDYSALCVIDSVRWIIGCNEGSILVTTDGGAHWSRKEYIINGFLMTTEITSIASAQQSIYFTTGMEGDVGEIYRSENLGQTVQRVFSGKQALRFITISDSGNGIAVGDSGYIVRLMKGTTTVMNGNDRSVEEFSLGQNYPNPFNPSTSAPYSLKQSGTVSIKIYDLLGREIASLVNEYRNAGSYSVRWNAHGLSSGTYLLRMESGSFSETKRIVLVK